MSTVNWNSSMLEYLTSVPITQVKAEDAAREFSIINAEVWRDHRLDSLRYCWGLEQDADINQFAGNHARLRPDIYKKICDGELVLRPSEEITKGMIQLHCHNARVAQHERVPFYEVFPVGEYEYTLHPTPSKSPLFYYRLDDGFPYGTQYTPRYLRRIKSSICAYSTPPSDATPAPYSVERKMEGLRFRTTIHPFLVLFGNDYWEFLLATEMPCLPMKYLQDASSSWIESPSEREASETESFVNEDIEIPGVSSENGAFPDVRQEVNAVEDVEMEEDQDMNRALDREDLLVWRSHVEPTGFEHLSKFISDVKMTKLNIANCTEMDEFEKDHVLRFKNLKDSLTTVLGDSNWYHDRVQNPKPWPRTGQRRQEFCTHDWIRGYQDGDVVVECDPSEMDDDVEWAPDLDSNLLSDSLRLYYRQMSVRNGTPPQGAQVPFRPPRPRFPPDYID